MEVKKRGKEGMYITDEDEWWKKNGGKGAMYFKDGRLYKYAQIEQFCFFRPRVFNMT